MPLVWMNLISYTVYSVSVTPHCYIELVTFSAVCIVEQSIYMYKALKQIRQPTSAIGLLLTFDCVQKSYS